MTTEQVSYSAFSGSAASNDSPVIANDASKLLKKNSHPIKFPCHRVIKNNGELGGYAGKLNNKEKLKLLNKEGIRIKDNKIDLDKYLHKF